MKIIVFINYLREKIISCQLIVGTYFYDCLLLLWLSVAFIKGCPAFKAGHHYHIWQIVKVSIKHWIVSGFRDRLKYHDELIQQVLLFLGSYTILVISPGGVHALSQCVREGLQGKCNDHSSFPYVFLSLLPTHLTFSPEGIVLGLWYFECSPK